MASFPKYLSLESMLLNFDLPPSSLYTLCFLVVGMLLGVENCPICCVDFRENGSTTKKVYDD
jgi:hypothetical protein